MCTQCAASYHREASKPTLGRCDWCLSDDATLRPKRDFEEGLAGPVYYVCRSCIENHDRYFIESEL